MYSLKSKFCLVIIPCILVLMGGIWALYIDINKDRVEINRNYLYVVKVLYVNNSEFSKRIEKIYYNTHKRLLEVEEDGRVRSIGLDGFSKIEGGRGNADKAEQFLKVKYNMHISAVAHCDSIVHFRGAPLSLLSDENFFVKNKDSLILIDTNVDVENSDFALEGFYAFSTEFVCYVSKLGSLIFVFDRTGNFLYSFSTIDKLGIPKVVVGNDGYRRHAADVGVVNSSASISDKYLYVLSNIRDGVEFKAIDVYSLENMGEYMYSIRVNREKTGYMPSSLVVKSDTVYLTFFNNLILAKILPYNE